MRKKIGNIRIHNIVARSRNHCCYGNAKMRSVCIVVDLHVSVTSMKPFSVAMEKQQWVPFALLSSYKIFRTALNIINVLTSSRSVSDIFVRS